MCVSVCDIMCVAMCCSVLQCVAVWRGTFVYAIWLVPMCDVSHLNMRQCRCVTCHIWIWGILYLCVTWHIIRDMIWLVHMCVAVCDKKCVAVFCSVKWHICIYEMACADVWRVWFVHMCVAVCDNMCVAVCCSVLLCEVTHLYMRHGLCRCVWRVAFD